MPCSSEYLMPDETNQELIRQVRIAIRTVLKGGK